MVLLRMTTRRIYLIVADSDLHIVHMLGFHKGLDAGKEETHSKVVNWIRKEYHDASSDGLSHGALSALFNILSGVIDKEYLNDS